MSCLTPCLWLALGGDRAGPPRSPDAPAAPRPGEGAIDGLVLRAGRPVAIRIPDDGGTLRGIAVWSDGRPFRGWIGATGFEDRALWAGEPSGEVHVAAAVETDADGRFALSGLPPALYRPTALVPGRVRFVGPPVRIPTEGELRFVVDEGWRKVPGRVVEDDTCRPVPGALVTQAQEEVRGHPLLARSTTDGRGRFEAWASTDYSYVHVSKEGFPDAWAHLNEGEEEIVVRLRRFGRVHGRVVGYEDGKPAPGAVVRVVRGGSAVAGTDGEYVLEEVEPGERLVYVHGGGFVSTLLVGEGERPLEPLVLTVDPGADLERDLTAVPVARARVTVRDAAGRPAPGFLVTLDGSPRGGQGQVRRIGEPISSRTGPDGSCEFDDLVPGVWYWCEVRGTDVRYQQGGKFQASPDEPAELVVRLEPGVTRTIRLVFVDTGEPVAGAVVEGWWGVQVTDADGTARIGPLLPGRCEAWVTHPDLAWSRDAVALPDGTGPATIRLSRGRSLGGRATWPDGRPAVGAFAVLAYGDWRYLSTPVTSDGSFLFRRVPQGELHELRAWFRRGDEDFTSEVVAPRAGALDHVLVLPEAPPEKPAEPEPRPERPRLVLAVTGPGGEPVESGTAVLWNRSGTWVGASRAASIREGTGAIPIAANPEALCVELTGCRARGRPLGARFVPVENASAPLTVRLDEGREICGRVVDRSGKGVIGARVVAVCDYSGLPKRADHPHAIARTGERGDFRLVGLGDLDYELRAVPPKSWSPGECRAHAGRTDVVVVVDVAATPVISVLDPDGKPVEKAWLRIEPEGGGPVVVNPCLSITGADGTLRPEGLDARKRYRLSFSRADGRSDLFPRTIEPWIPRDTEIRLARAYEIAGVVRDADGQAPRGHAAVYLRRKGEAEWKWDWTRRGAFRFGLLTAGEYELKAAWTHSHEADETLPVVVVKAGAVEVVLTLPAAK